MDTSSDTDGDLLGGLSGIALALLGVRQIQIEPTDTRDSSNCSSPTH